MSLLRFAVIGAGTVFLVAACTTGPSEEPPTSPTSTPHSSQAPQPPHPPPAAPPAAPNRPPQLQANVKPTEGVAPLEVTFNLCRSTDPDGDELSFRIAFGDGGTSHRCQDSHVYAKAGDYMAFLSVSDGKGGTDSRNVPVKVTSEPKPYYPLDAVGHFTWINDLDVPDATRAHVTLNGGTGFFPRRGHSHAVGEAHAGDNLVSGIVTGGGDPGRWRFEMGENSAFVPGSIRVVSGVAEELTESAVTFRLSGRADERIAFSFEAAR